MLEKIIESLRNCEPDKALIYAEKALAFAKEQCGGSVPSGDHGYLEELAGLLRVTRSQRDAADSMTCKCGKELRVGEIMAHKCQPSAASAGSSAPWEWRYEDAGKIGIYRDGTLWSEINAGAKGIQYAVRMVILLNEGEKH